MIWKIPPSAILSDAARAFAATAHLAIPITLAFEAPLVVTQLLSEEVLPYEGKALFSLISLIAQGAVLVLVDRWQRGEPLQVGPALRASVRAYARMFITAIVAELLVILFALLLVIPGILRALSYAAAMPIALHEGEMGRGACDVSAERTRGSRLAIALTMIPAWILPNAIDLAIFLGERDGSTLVGTPASSALAGLGTALAFLPLLYVIAAIYGRTRPATEPEPDATYREPATHPPGTAPRRGRAKARSPRRGRG